ncbi:MAG: NAD(P)/FAD-dependent oxidoreductase [Faecalibacillus intestinalis]|uniref:NAD(P)/FAD-dependent oxidoreductase n=1 Tax=Faecalibacillus intestinalis TaxID=1982626 RepID=UPI003992880A
MLKVSNIAVSLDEKDYAKVIANTLNIRKSQVKNVKIAKKAVDARRKNKVHFNMGFTFEYVDEDQLLKTHSKQVSKVKEYHYDKLTPNNQTIMVVGSGPAGLFCAYNLARSGQKVILIEQGKCVDERKKDIDTYLETGKLNTQSNVQYGASEDILYLNKPHLGTDVLINVVKNIRKDIEKCGDVRFETKLVDIIIEDNQLKEVVLENNEGTYKEKVDQLVLAIGHSARKTYEMLYQKQLEISQKAFAVGMRIEHSQEFINKSQYGKFYDHPALKAADYKLAVHTSQKRGVYTFCMCPGGYVMNAASEEKRLVVNGMSNYKRDNKYANSAVLVNVTPDDFGSSHPLAGMYFQRKLEEKAFELGGSDYSIPVQKVEDYLENKEGIENIETSLKRVKNANLNALLPEILNINLKEGLLLMNNKINGFTSNATLLGVESRSSAPIRFYRDENMESNIKGIYPIGEGAGYAGGIMSSAIDGLKCSEVLLKGER